MAKSPDWLDKLSWFNALVTTAVVLILIVAGGETAMRLRAFDPMELAGAIFLLLVLPVLVKLVSRRPKPRVQSEMPRGKRPR